MEITDQSFNIVDIKPANMEELTEVGLLNVNIWRFQMIWILRRLKKAAIFRSATDEIRVRFYKQWIILNFFLSNGLIIEFKACIFHIY